MYAEPGKGAIHGAKDLRHGDVYLRLGLSTYSPNWYISYRQLGLPESIGVESPFGTRELLEEASPDLILPDAGHLSGRFGPR